MRKKTRNQFDQKILLQDKYFSKKVLIGLSEGNALLNNCFGPYIQSDKKFSSEDYTIQLMCYHYFMFYELRS